MQIMLCDGKHFRAGRQGLRRVAIFFIDDASRYVPQVVVGPSETAVLFLRGLHGVLTNLDVGIVHGTVGYPPGRGKIERFNRTAEDAIPRHLARDDVDPDCMALELRLAHYLEHDYNRQPHSSLGKQAPEARFLADDRPLRRACMCVVHPSDLRDTVQSLGDPVTVVLIGRRCADAVSDAVLDTADLIIVPEAWLKRVPRTALAERARMAARIASAHRAGQVEQRMRRDRQWQLPF